MEVQPKLLANPRLVCCSYLQWDSLTMSFSVPPSYFFLYLPILPLFILGWWECQVGATAFWNTTFTPIQSTFTSIIFVGYPLATAFWNTTFTPIHNIPSLVHVVSLAHVGTVYMGIGERASSYRRILTDVVFLCCLQWDWSVFEKQWFPQSTYIQVHTYIHSAGKWAFVFFVQVMYPNDTGQGPNNYTPS